MKPVPEPGWTGMTQPEAGAHAPMGAAERTPREVLRRWSAERVVGDGGSEEIDRLLVGVGKSHTDTLDVGQARQLRAIGLAELGVAFGGNLTQAVVEGHVVLFSPARI